MPYLCFVIYLFAYFSYFLIFSFTSFRGRLWEGAVFLSDLLSALVHKKILKKKRWILPFKHFFIASPSYVTCLFIYFTIIFLIS